VLKQSILHRSIYQELKKKTYRSFGLKIVPKRNTYIADLLKNELKLPHISNQSHNYSVDIGCGNGCLTKVFSEILNMETIGVDVSKAFIDGHNFTFLCATAHLLPFKSKSIDLVLAVSLVEHLPEVIRSDFYTEISEVLIDKGLLVMQLPNRYFPIEHHSFLPFVGYLPSRFHAIFFHEYYVSVPSKDSVVEQLEEAGFKVIKVVGYGIPFSKLLDNRLFNVIPFGYLIIAKKAS
jgi:SAM-dependent methyltransferase